MSNPLKDLSRAELLETVQDFQDCISEIEGHLNDIIGGCKLTDEELVVQFRRTIDRFIHKEVNNGPERIL